MLTTSIGHAAVEVG